MLSAWSDFQGVRVRGMHGHAANMARRTIRSHAILSVAVESHSSVSATYPPAFVRPFPLRRLHRVPSASSHRMRLGSSTADWRSRNPPAPGGLDNLHLLFASAQKRGNVQFEGLGGADRDEGHAIEHIRMPIRRIRSACCARAASGHPELTQIAKCIRSRRDCQRLRNSSCNSRGFR